MGKNYVKLVFQIILLTQGTLLYSSSKNASHSMMKTMSKEYGAFNITFNTLALLNFKIMIFEKLNKRLRKKILG